MQNSMLANYCMSKSYFSTDDCLSLLSNAWTINLAFNSLWHTPDTCITVFQTAATINFALEAKILAEREKQNKTKQTQKYPTLLMQRNGRKPGAWFLKIFQVDFSTYYNDLFLNSAPGCNPRYLVCNSHVQP